jgi:hypothetical protein
MTNHNVKISTKELNGRALDWALMMAEGENIEIYKRHPGIVPKISRDLSQFGYLVTKYRVNISFCIDLQDSNRAYVWADLDGRRAHGYSSGHDQPLVAVCRAIVAARLGETVEIPLVLLPDSNQIRECPVNPALIDHPVRIKMLTDADAQALDAMPDDVWFKLMDSWSSSINRPQYRLERLVGAGALEQKVQGIFPEIYSEYRKVHK